MDAKEEDDLGERAAGILYPLFIGQFFSIIFTAATFIVVARLLGPVSYGLYVFAFGFSTFVNGFAAFGVGAYFSNIIAKLAYNKDGEGILRALTSGYIIAGVVGIVLTLFGIAISGYVASIFTNVGISSDVLMLTSSTIIFMIINTITVSGLIGFSRAGLAAITNVVIDFIQLLLSIILTIEFGVDGAVAGMLIGYIIGAVVGTYLLLVASSKYIKFRISIPSFAHLKSVFNFVTPIAATNFLNTGMQNFSILFLGLFVTTAALGNYGAASRGLALLSLVYMTLGSGLYPIFTTARAIDHDGSVTSTFNKIIKFALMLMLPVVIYVGVMAGPGLFLLVSGAYATAPYYLTLIAIGTTIGLFGTYVNNLLISEGYTGSVLKINAISAVFQLVFMVILVPYYFVLGAILVIFFLGNIIEAWLFAREATKLFRMKFEYTQLILLYASNIVFGVIIALFANTLSNFLLIPNLYVKYSVEIIAVFILSIAIYPLILVLFRAISRLEMKNMRHATMKLGRVSIIFGTFFDYSEYLYNVLIGP